MIISSVCTPTKLVYGDCTCILLSKGLYLYDRILIITEGIGFDCSPNLDKYIFRLYFGNLRLGLEGKKQ